MPYQAARSLIRKYMSFNRALREGSWEAICGTVPHRLGGTHAADLCTAATAEEGEERAVAFPEHGGDLAWASKRYGMRPEKFLDFSSSVNPLGPAPSALKAARWALKCVSSYPEPGADSLKRSLASWLGTGSSRLTLGNGSTELIYHLVRCRSPRRVTVVSPSFSEYERAARAAGAEVERFLLSPSDGFALDTDALARAAARSEMIFFCNPASPTGALYRREELLPVLEVCRKKGGLLVVDESFMGFCPAEEGGESTLMPLAGEEGLAVISTCTKLFALAGLRGPGWLAGTRELVAEMEETGVPWRVNRVAAAAAHASLADDGYLRRTRTSVRAWREELATGLGKIGIFQVYPSRVNYLLLRLREERPDAAALVDELGRRGILVRCCFNFHGLGERFIRVAVRRPRENKKLLRALREVMSI